MRLGSLLIFALAAFMLGAGAVQPVAKSTVRFVAIEVHIDPSGHSLGAYQVEIVMPGARLVGVEGGIDESFASPPHYDPRALHNGGQERVIIAALAEGLDRVAHETVVAVLHYAIDSDIEPDPRCVLIAAGDDAANRLHPACRVILVELQPQLNEGDEP